MLKNFLELFRKESLLKQAFARSQETLEADREMFLAAIRSLRRHRWRSSPPGTDPNRGTPTATGLRA